MTKILTTIALVLVSLGWARALEPFSISSPDKKFEAIYAPFNEPPFEITEKITHRIVSVMDDERVGNHGVSASWAPDSKVLVVLVEWRLFTEVHVFRLVDGRFERNQGPKAPEDFLTLGNWVGPNKVQMKGEKKTRVLKITDNAAMFAQ